MTVSEINILHDKAKAKKDGVYAFKGNLWIVCNSKFIAYADQSGVLLQRTGSFNVIIGQLDLDKRYEWNQKLKEWLKNYKLKMHANN